MMSFRHCLLKFAPMTTKRIRIYSTSSPKTQKIVENEKDSGLYKIATVPNAICLARIGATPLIGYFVVQHQFTPAFAMFVIAGASDMLDGWIARNVPGQKSLLGSVLDPVADKLLVSVMFVTMTHAQLIPLPLTTIVLLRDVLLITGGFYKRYKSMEPPYTLNRFFNPQVSSMQVMPTNMSKVNTLFQLSLVALSLASPVFDFSPIANDAIFGLGCLTAFTTIYSGLQYASGKAFKKISK
ncbi:unnamed protein product [Caenorhabditis angaria]|uniref:cardiolipin synthase (CMP-forming) n=1 Tax=Caenorhabditis angaria TaxID=860376 RepID=A0A9P1MXJ2_9PELO|nr:unnamed protein product [Caenorhabditis angaria]